MKELCCKLGSHKTRISAYNPRGNGQVESLNRNFAARLSMLIEAKDKTDWDIQLPAALLAIRTSPNAAVSYSEVNLTQRLMYQILKSKEQLDSSTSCCERKSKSFIGEGKQCYKITSRTGDRLSPFEEGDKVWIENPVTLRNTSRKLHHNRWEGLLETTYKILPDTRSNRELES